MSTATAWLKPTTARRPTTKMCPSLKTPLAIKTSFLQVTCRTRALLICRTTTAFSLSFLAALTPSCVPAVLAQCTSAGCRADPCMGSRRMSQRVRCDWLRQTLLLACTPASLQVPMPAAAAPHRRNYPFLISHASGCAAASSATTAPPHASACAGNVRCCNACLAAAGLGLSVRGQERGDGAATAGARR